MILKKWVVALIVLAEVCILSCASQKKPFYVDNERKAVESYLEKTGTLKRNVPVRKLPDLDVPLGMINVIWLPEVCKGKILAEKKCGLMDPESANDIKAGTKIKVLATQFNDGFFNLKCVTLEKTQRVLAIGLYPPMYYWANENFEMISIPDQTKLIVDWD